MSSMFKKKAGMAFKPKIPPRARPSGPTPTQPPKAPVSSVLNAPTILDSAIEPSVEQGTPVSEAPRTEGIDEDTPPTSSNESLITATAPAQEPSTTQAIPKSPVRTRASVTSQTSAAEERTRNEHPIPATAAHATENQRATEHNSTVSIPEVAQLKAPAEAAKTLFSESRSTPTDNNSSTRQPTSKPRSHDTEPLLPQQAQLETPPPTIVSQSSAASSESAAPAPSVESQPESSRTAPGPSTVKARATKKAPAKTTRKRAPQADDETETQGDAAAPKAKRQRKKKVVGDGQETQPRPRKRKSPSEGVDGDGADAEARKRAWRAVTPEDAEEQVLDTSTMKMAELTRDLHIGKKFSRHDELLQRHRERIAAANKKKAKDGGEVQDAVQAEGATSGAGNLSANQQGQDGVGSAGTNSGPTPSGPQFQIVDGQIVVDQSSLVMDRHARAAAEAAASGQTIMEIEENDFTHLTNSSSYRSNSKLKGPNSWSDEDTELFYRGLQMFGTDFQMISRMFPDKGRRHVKMKFNREERHAPARINATLIGEKTLKIDLEEYKTWTRTEYESVDDIYAQQKAKQAEYDAEQTRLVDEQAEINRKKREALFSDGPGDQNAENTDGKGRRRKGTGKGKKKHVETNMRGEVITS